jgi:hypothetical protein
MSPTPATSLRTTSVVKRYTDSYRAAKFQTGIGTIVKIASIAVGVLIALVAVIAASSIPIQQPGFFGPTVSIVAPLVQGLGVLGGAVIAGIGFLFGVMISAQGQLLKASLDAAVNTSPFLANEDRAEVMSL